MDGGRKLALERPERQPVEGGTARRLHAARVLTARVWLVEDVVAQHQRVAPEARRHRCPRVRELVGDPVAVRVEVVECAVGRRSLDVERGVWKLRHAVGDRRPAREAVAVERRSVEVLVGLQQGVDVVQAEHLAFARDLVEVARRDLPALRLEPGPEPCKPHAVEAPVLEVLAVAVGEALRRRLVGRGLVGYLEAVDDHDAALVVPEPAPVRVQPARAGGCGGRGCRHSQERCKCDQRPAHQKCMFRQP